MPSVFTGLQFVGRDDPRRVFCIQLSCLVYFNHPDPLTLSLSLTVCLSACPLTSPFSPLASLYLQVVEAPKPCLARLVCHRLCCLLAIPTPPVSYPRLVLAQQCR